LLTALTLFLVIVGQYLGGGMVLVIGWALRLLQRVRLFLFSDKIALYSSGAQPVSRETTSASV